MPNSTITSNSSRFSGITDSRDWRNKAICCNFSFCLIASSVTGRLKEVDLKADVSDFASPMDYYLSKTNELLQFGVERVIWLNTISQTIMEEDLKPRHWNTPVEIIARVHLSVCDLAHHYNRKKPIWNLIVLIYGRVVSRERYTNKSPVCEAGFCFIFWLTSSCFWHITGLHIGRRQFGAEVFAVHAGNVSHRNFLRAFGGTGSRVGAGTKPLGIHLGHHFLSPGFTFSFALRQ